MSQRTTLSVSIDDEVARDVRAEAERQQRPLSWVVEALLRDAMKRAARRAAHPVKA